MFFILLLIEEPKITRIKENLNFDFSVKSKIKKMLLNAIFFNKKDTNNLMNHFVVIKKRSSDYDCKIHEVY